MKTNTLTLGIVMAFLGGSTGCSQEKPTKKIKKESHKVINRKIDEGFGKLLARRRIRRSKVPRSKPGTPARANSRTRATGRIIRREAAAEEAKPELKWAKYDFVPGDRVIFEDNLLGEENGEFPSRWDLDEGIVEVAEFGGENVIMFRDGAPAIIPYFEEAREDYLPDVFTLEFDLYCITLTFDFISTTERTRNRVVPPVIPIIYR